MRQSEVVDFSTSLQAGARNLLTGCAGAMAGQRVTIFREDPAFGYYGEGLAEAIFREAQELGLHANLIDAPFRETVAELPQDVLHAINGSDHLVFAARLGDQLRFGDIAGGRAVVSYALDCDMLASPFGTAPYGAFLDLKKTFDRMFASAQSIRVTCPLGTNFSGRMPQPPEAAPIEVGIKRFPMSVFTPLPARHFSGTVALARFLVGTGCSYYQPFGATLDAVIHLDINDGRIVRWRGPPTAVAAAQAHTQYVARRFGLDAGSVHSWHAGIHPACAYSQTAASNYERWGGGAFGNPRILHFHACGGDRPGEISWNILDPTVEVDGHTVWKDGRIDTSAIAGAAAIIESYPEVAHLFADPAQDVGID